jgi:hypothetical protein
MRLPHVITAAFGRLPNAQELHFPVAIPSRVAVLECGFAVSPGIREFACDEFDSLAAWLPEALVLALPAALKLAARKPLPRLTSWIVLLTSLANQPLEQQHRDLLWHSFGVPVFEQLRGWDGNVIARECEVHDGLHVDQSAGILETSGGNLIVTADTGLTAEVIKENCECGAETPRLRRLVKVKANTRYAVA